MSCNNAMSVRLHFCEFIHSVYYAQVWQFPMGICDTATGFGSADVCIQCVFCESGEDDRVASLNYLIASFPG